MEATTNTTKKILITCIAVSILGISLITAIDYGADAKRVNLSELGSKLAGENIMACGIVKSKSVSQTGTTFMTIAENGSKARIIFFKNERYKTENISRGESVCVNGVVQIYNNNAEIIGRKIIEVINNA
ncbi:MAG: OB-fold nucleic acid binding domain-containing protein [Nanoarchaeota archaeon]|nr:OB-fold nucleic acid binding domain-containing protein [Nanoarchaeota archaeon]MBU4452063.1 OB-fold nucleic acid binding domain-containing protein [Nanoarchaeota archaeon]MCG2724444.1 OB-fold nucleic acid binding domain-containing protein [archaeon]